MYSTVIFILIIYIITNKPLAMCRKDVKNIIKGNILWEKK
ncbi:hypothetical protein yaldo0001_14860 [Yersinia aldovae ATCC 35236]|nr:hypothetical protein yaldo0001_14860 [Yersinia aldovae ATCC 35236]